jgi:hypothetical protein
VAATDVGRERGSGTEGSVVERVNSGGEVIGGVPVCEGRTCRVPVGSVVRRNDGGCDSVAEGVVASGDDSGDGTTAAELVGLAVVVGTLKADLRGEFGLDDEWV